MAQVSDFFPVFENLRPINIFALAAKLTLMTLRPEGSVKLHNTVIIQIILKKKVGQFLPVLTSKRCHQLGFFFSPKLQVLKEPGQIPLAIGLS